MNTDKNQRGSKAYQEGRFKCLNRHQRTNIKMHVCWMSIWREGSIAVQTVTVLVPHGRIRGVCYILHFRYRTLSCSSVSTRRSGHMSLGAGNFYPPSALYLSGINSSISQQERTESENDLRLCTFTLLTFNNWIHYVTSDTNLSIEMTATTQLSSVMVKCVWLTAATFL